MGSISDSGVKTSNVNSAAVVGLSGVELVGMNNCSTPVQSNANTKAGGRIKSLSADGIV